MYRPASKFHDRLGRRAKPCHGLTYRPDWGARQPHPGLRVMRINVFTAPAAPRQLCLVHDQPPSDVHHQVSELARTHWAYGLGFVLPPTSIPGAWHLQGGISMLSSVSTPRGPVWWPRRGRSGPPLFALYPRQSSALTHAPRGIGIFDFSHCFSVQADRTGYAFALTWPCSAGTGCDHRRW